MTNSKISVVVPVYKSEQYLDRCMCSILGSSFVDIEVILIDDGSPDGMLCDKYALEDKRVRVVRHEINKGLSAVRNEGVRQTRSPYISFIDSDDWILPSALSDMYRLARENSADIVSCGVAEHLKGNVYRGKDVACDSVVLMGGKEALKRSLLADPTASHTAWGKLYRTRLFEKVLYPEGRLYEDAATTYLLYAKAKKVVHTKKPLYCYAINNTGIANSGFKPSSMDKLIAADEIIAFIQRYAPEFLDYAFCFKVVSALRIAADFTSEVRYKYPSQYKEVRSILHDPKYTRSKSLSGRHRILILSFKYCKLAFHYMWKRRLNFVR